MSPKIQGFSEKNETIPFMLATGHPALCSNNILGLHASVWFIMNSDVVGRAVFSELQKISKVMELLASSSPH